MKTKLELAYEKYLNEFSIPKITPYIVCDSEQKKQDVTVYTIETERSILKPLHSITKQFNEYSQQIKELYSSTLGDEKVTSLYMDGKPHTEGSFQNRVNLQSERWENGYPFSAFEIVNKEESEISEHNVVIGYEVIGNGCKPNAGEIAILIAEKFQGLRFGHEVVGAITGGYGQYLFNKESVVNKGLPSESVFTRVLATANIHNVASNKIFEQRGFSNIGETEKWGFTRNEWELKYTPNEISSYNIENPVEISGIVELWQE